MKKHTLEIEIDRDESSAHISYTCACGRRSGGKNLVEPTPSDIGDEVSYVVRKHREHVWVTGMEK